MKFIAITLMIIFVSIQPTFSKENKNADSKTKDGFSATLYTTTDASTFLRWEKPSDGFDVHNIGRVIKGQKFFPLIVFNNCQADKNKFCKISYEISFTAPSGKSYLKEKIVGWNELKRSGAMELVRNYLTISFDPPDEFGIYLIKAKVLDENANKEVELNTSLTLAK